MFSLQIVPKHQRHPYRYAGPVSSVSWAADDEAQRLYSTHPLFAKGRVRNYRTVTKVDLEARYGIERLSGPSPQRILRGGDI